MLRDIRYHIEDDAEKQAELEEKLATRIQQMRQRNMNAFQRNISSLLPLISQSQSQNISVFCNKLGYFNFVDYGLGRVVYGLEPEQEIQRQVEHFLREPTFISLTESEDVIRPDRNIDCLVVLGCGLGYHIAQLLEQVSIKHLILYEPEVQYFTGSTFITDWQYIFSLAKQKGTALYLQIGKDGRNLVEDIEQLQGICPLEGFSVYKHYNHLVFNQLSVQLETRAWQEITARGLHLQMHSAAVDYLPIWTPPVATESFKPADDKHPLKTSNLAAFKRYFPDIYAQFAEYEPQAWRPMIASDGRVNIQHLATGTYWYGEQPIHEAQESMQFFAKHPHKDGLVLGYNGKKLLHYLHFQFVKQTEKLLEEAQEGENNLPEDIPSIILFGLGNGYQLEQLHQQYKLDKVFICEPNTDFFYASLFAIDWAEILESIDRVDGRLYINIGDDGSHLVADLLNQFTAVGPYLLNQTYFYRGYYNGLLNEAIANLREQLRIMISMGEYFDHAFYGINHTDAAIEKGAKFLIANPDQHLPHEVKEVPVFIVGNGPSIDKSIETIKEYRDQVILISCGTVLQVLHRNGITPDFHAEIEQNRTTFDWACLIDDPEYLSQISLLSCNGIHPDTIDLYKDVYLAFKAGESSTVVAQEVLGKGIYQELEYAFPTVSNLVVDFVTTMGFETAYLFGIDLGFIDQKHHHSKSSGYYTENGEELYDYSEQNNTSLIVPGNFRQSVFTKHEFKLSKQVMEQRLKQKKGAFYNCSDGARIIGTSALSQEDVLLTNTTAAKKTGLDKCKKEAFLTLESNKYIRDKEKKYPNQSTIDDIQRFIGVIEKNSFDIESTASLPITLKEINFESYNRKTSLMFYYLYGSINFFSAALAKLLVSPCEKLALEISHKHICNWLKSLEKTLSLINSAHNTLDNSSFNSVKRQNLLNSRIAKNRKVILTSSSDTYKNLFKHELALTKWAVGFDYKRLYENEIDNETVRIFHLNDVETQQAIKECDLSFMGLGIESDCYISLASERFTNIKHLCEKYPNLKVIPFLKSDNNTFGLRWRHDLGHNAYTTLRIAIIEAQGNIIIPKLRTCSWQDDKVSLWKFFHLDDDVKILDFGMYLTIQLRSMHDTQLLSKNGSRATEIFSPLTNKELIFYNTPKATYEKQRAHHIELLSKNEGESQIFCSDM